jgi:exopolyphosphatase/pppGpp-phosphohydrolase
MTTTTALVLAGLGLAIIAGLAAYAYTLRQEVRRRQAFREEEERRARDNCLENLELVASALLQEQVDVTEGAWRCKVLLEILDPRLLERESFRPFGEVYERTRHLHTHAARKALTPKERFKEDRERLSVEEELREAVLEAARAALVFRRDWPASLH